MLQFARWITERDFRAALMAAGLVLLPLLAPASCAVLALVALQRGPGAAWRSGRHGRSAAGRGGMGLTGAHPGAGCCPR
jgi:ABC-type Fe3+ transport system permease subunit